MLKDLDPLLGPDLLAALCAMGHGDEIAIVDANFPAAASAQRLIRLDGVTATRALEAVLSVIPLDDFVEQAAFCMAVVGASAAEAPIHMEFRDILCRHETGTTAALGSLERTAFYARAKTAFAVIATGEARLYGNILLTKGVVRPTRE